MLTGIIVEAGTSLTSTGRIRFVKVPLLFKTFKADIAEIIPSDPSNIPASTTVSYLVSKEQPSISSYIEYYTLSRYVVPVKKKSKYSKIKGMREQLKISARDTK